MPTINTYQFIKALSVPIGVGSLNYKPGDKISPDANAIIKIDWAANKLSYTIGANTGSPHTISLKATDYVNLASTDATNGMPANSSSNADQSGQLSASGFSLMPQLSVYSGSGAALGAGIGYMICRSQKAPIWLKGIYIIVASMIGFASGQIAATVMGKINKD